MTYKIDNLSVLVFTDLDSSFLSKNDFSYGNNLNIKGAIINASADDSNFLRLVAADDVLILSGPQNPDTGGQTFVGGGFNNELMGIQYCLCLLIHLDKA